MAENKEAVQFHPTALAPSGILVTEGCRGDGGFLLDKDHDRFMVEAEPEKQELASRDVVSRHMAQRMRDGKGVETPYGPHLWLDIRHLGEEHVTTKLREVFDICRDFVGLHPARDLIPVRPTQHYSMGGVRVNKDGEAYNLAGLFAAGLVVFSILDIGSTSDDLPGELLAQGVAPEVANGAALDLDIGIWVVAAGAAVYFAHYPVAIDGRAEGLAHFGNAESRAFEVVGQVEDVLVGDQVGLGLVAAEDAYGELAERIDAVNI